jgi:thymidylate synthase
VYETHIDAIETQLQRQMYGFPKLSINKKEKWEDYTEDDFKLVDYKHGDKIYAPMSA